MAPASEQLIGALSWDIAAINSQLENIRRIWAQVLGLSGPQWLILMAINDLDPGIGVSVGDVSAKLNVKSTFVTTETKMLEKSGFVTRKPSETDGRIVLMSLTDRARREIAHLSAQRNKMNESIFADLPDERLSDVATTLSLIRRRMEKAALQLQLDRTNPDT